MNHEATAFADFDLDNILNPGPANADFTDVTIDDIFREYAREKIYRKNILIKIIDIRKRLDLYIDRVAAIC